MPPSRSKRRAPSSTGSATSSSSNPRTAPSAASKSSSSFQNTGPLFASSAPFSSIRRSVSQLFSSFTPGSKRRRRDITPHSILSSKGKERAIDEDEGESSPRASQKKRARIAAPDALGREESRHLLAMLDDAQQPKYDRDMIDALDHPKSLRRAPDDNENDDAEVEDFLGIDDEPLAGPSSRPLGGPVRSPSSEVRRRSPSRSIEQKEASEELASMPNGHADPSSSTIDLESVLPASSSEALVSQALLETASSSVVAEPQLPNGNGIAKLDSTDPISAFDGGPGPDGRRSMSVDVIEEAEPLSSAKFPNAAEETRMPMLGNDSPERVADPQPRAQYSEEELQRRSQESTQALQKLLYPPLPKATFEIEEDSIKLATEAVEEAHEALDQIDPPIPNGVGNMTQEEKVVSSPTAPVNITTHPFDGMELLQTEQIETALPEESRATEQPSTVDIGVDGITSKSDEGLEGVMNGVLEEHALGGHADTEVGLAIGEELDEAQFSEVEDASGAAVESAAPETVPADDAEAGAPAVIDFTVDDSSDDEEDVILVAQQAHISPQRSAFVHSPSSGLLNGPLREAEQRSRNPQLQDPVVDIIRSLGQTTLRNHGRESRGRGPYSPAGRSDVTTSSIFASQRYTKGKRPSLLERDFKSRNREKRIVELKSLRAIFSQPANAVRRHLISDEESFVKYRQYLGAAIQQSQAPLPKKIDALQKVSKDVGKSQKQLRRLLGKSLSSADQIKVALTPEQKRLRREQLLRERRFRGILGRPPLPKSLEPSQEAIVSAALANPSWKVDITGASARQADIARLGPRSWINDESINFYMAMINLRSTEAETQRANASEALAAARASGDKVAETKAIIAEKKWRAYYRVHAFNSYFWTKLDSPAGYSSVARWTRRIDLFSKDLILIPCNLGNSHWTCATINLRAKRFEYYDSMAGIHPLLLAKLRNYLTSEMIDKKRQGAVDVDKFQDYFATHSSPQQRNGFDCGIFSCATLEQLSRRDPHYPFDVDPPPLDVVDDGYEDEGDDEDGVTGTSGGDGYEWNFSQNDMPYLRRRIIYEITQKKLLD